MEDSIEALQDSFAKAASKLLKQTFAAESKLRSFRNSLKVDPNNFSRANRQRILSACESITSIIDEEIHQVKSQRLICEKVTGPYQQHTPKHLMLAQIDDHLDNGQLNSSSKEGPNSLSHDSKRKLLVSSKLRNYFIANQMAKRIVTAVHAHLFLR